jgi:hypothetical protein
MMRCTRATAQLIVAGLLALAAAGAAAAADIRSIESFLANDGGDLPFEGASNRIAMLTFEDPDGTGLGDDIAFLASKRVLFDAGVESLAIILFEQGLEPDASGLSYFEKVDRITEGRNFVAALWGHISRDADELVIDTFVQVYSDRAPRLFDVELEFAAFDKPLRASVAPRRIWAQSVRLPLSAIEEIHAIAASVRTLRETPDREAPPVENALLLEGTTYRIVDRSDDWTHVALHGSDLHGWTSVDAFCGGEGPCAGIVAGAGFLNELLRYVNHRGSALRVADDATRTARAVGDQVLLIEMLRDPSGPSSSRFDEVMRTTSTWTQEKSAPGGATFVNLQSLAQLRQLEREGGLDPEKVRALANRLARASLDDPGNLDLLHNLSVLFGFLGDLDRSELAQTLYQTQSARSGH